MTELVLTLLIFLLNSFFGEEKGLVTTVVDLEVYEFKNGKFYFGDSLLPAFIRGGGGGATANNPRVNKPNEFNAEGVLSIGHWDQGDAMKARISHDNGLILDTEFNVVSVQSDGSSSSAHHQIDLKQELLIYESHDSGAYLWRQEKPPKVLGVPNAHVLGRVSGVLLQEMFTIRSDGFRQTVRLPLKQDTGASKDRMARHAAVWREQVRSLLRRQHHVFINTVVKHLVIMNWQLYVIVFTTPLLG
jgi:hypothetical protein